MLDAEEQDGARPFAITTIGDDRRPKIDLSQFTTEAMLAEVMRADAEAMRADAQKKGVPLHHYDPDFKPRAKGQKLDKHSEEHRKAVEAAVRGLPPVSDMTWMETQLFDNGPANGRHAHTQFVLKFTGTTAAAGALVNADKRALSATHYCYLSTPKNFIRNLKRKKEQHALAPEEWSVVERIMTDLSTVEASAGRPEALVGALSCKLHGEGTVRSVGQFATLVWTDQPMEGVAPVQGWRPVVFLYQYFRWLDHRQDETSIILAPPPVIKPGRKPTACAWYARQESAEFTRLIEQASDPNAALRERMQAWRKAA